MQRQDPASVRAAILERPVEYAAIAIAAVIGVSKVIDNLASARSKNAYAKQINRKKKSRS